MLRINLLSHRYCCTNGEHGKDKRKKKEEKYQNYTWEWKKLQKMKTRIKSLIIER